MKVDEFLEMIPAEFATECLAALPGGDRKRLLKAHQCRVKMGPGTLRKKDRIRAEAAKLMTALKESDDPEEKRSLFQGWLARRAEMIVSFLEIAEIPHESGFVENFDWVQNLTREQVDSAMDKVRAQVPNVASDKAFAVYFGYLEVPFLKEMFDLEKLLSSPEEFPEPKAAEEKQEATAE